MKKLYLIDGMSLVFRAYHAMTRSGFRSPGGEPTGATFGFTNLITSLMEKEQPEYIAVVFDRSEPTFRHIKFPAYKANRAEFPEELVPQLARIKNLLDLLALPQLELAGYEADDIIGTISQKASSEGIEVICLTSDKDYYQLVNDNVKLYKPGKEGNDFDIVGIEGVYNKFGVLPSQVIDVLALIGDTSDNVPGVRGIGDKTAIPLIQQFGSLENLYNNLDKVSSKSVKTKLEAGKESAFAAKDLVTICLETPIEYDIDKLKAGNPDFAALDGFFASLGFTQIRKKWLEKGLKYKSTTPPNPPLDNGGSEEEKSPQPPFDNGGSEEEKSPQPPFFKGGG